MNSRENPSEFYKRFLNQLESSQEWPGLYIFKFILKSESKELLKLKKIFEKIDNDFSIVNSSKNNFKSLTFKTKMKSPQEVIQIYKKVRLLKGVIIL